MLRYTPSMLLLLSAIACDQGLKCGEGTHEEDGYCLPDAIEGATADTEGGAVGDTGPPTDTSEGGTGEDSGEDTEPGVDTEPGTETADTGPVVPPLTVEELLGLTWEAVPGAETRGAVIDVAEGTWRSGYVARPTVHYDGELFRMWFVGGVSAAGYPYDFLERIGFATSEDGIHWTVENGDAPVMEPGAEGSIDDKGLSHPFVLRVEDTWWMWYAAINGDLVGHVRVEQMALATSKDGVNWTRRNEPVITAGQRMDGLDRTQVDGAHVLQDEGGGFTMIHQLLGDANHVLAMSTSEDGVTWTPVPDGWPITGFSGNQQLGVSAHRDASGAWFALYQWVPFGRGWTTFAATSVDGLRWTPAYDHQQVLPPWEEGELGSNEYNHSVHPSQLVVLEDRVLFWFNAEEAPGITQRIGLAQALR